MRKLPKSSFSTIAVKASPFPKAKQEAPFNSITIQFSKTPANNTGFIVNGLDIGTALKAQIELPSTVDVVIRVSEFKIFDLASRRLEVRIWDGTTPTGNNTNLQLATERVFPSRDAFSAARFILAKAIAARPIIQTANGVFLTGEVGTPLGITSVATTEVLFQVNLLWRIRQVTDNPGTTLSLLPSSFQAMDIDNNKIPKSTSGTVKADRKSVV